MRSDSSALSGPESVARAAAPVETYLDWNATTPPLPAVLAAVMEAAAEAWGNPSSVHAAGRRARRHLDAARDAIAALAGGDARDIVLTSGGTEANNLALSGAPGLVVSRVDHPSLTRVAEAAAARGVPVRWLPVVEAGLIAPDDVEHALSDLPRGSLVALSAVNHETGVIQPLDGIRVVVDQASARLHVDAVQAAGRVVPGLWQKGDTTALAGHKLRGPKGIGALVVTRGARVSPVLVGGAQERGLRPGTPDAAAAAGLAVAARHALEGPPRYAPLAALRDRIESALDGEAIVNGSGAPRAPHVTNLSFYGVAGDELVAALDLEGIRVSSGSACSAGTNEPSTVITAMLGRERAESAVRVSMGEETQPEAIERLLGTLARLLQRLRR